MGYLLVLIGGGIGAALRHRVDRAFLFYFGGSFPYGTFIVNVTGGLLMGFLAGLFSVKTEVDEGTRLFLTTGLLGGFTTFSAFDLDAALMWQRGDSDRLRSTLQDQWCSRSQHSRSVFGPCAH